MLTPDDATTLLEARQQLWALIVARGPGKTVCPSEAARSMAPEDWRSLMPIVRAAAAELIADGQAACYQRGRIVSLSAARGPVRFGMPPTAGTPPAVEESPEAELDA